MRPQEFDICFGEYVEDNSNDAETEVNVDNNYNYNHLSQLKVNKNVHEARFK